LDDKLVATATSHKDLSGGCSFILLCCKLPHSINHLCSNFENETRATLKQ